MSAPLLYWWAANGQEFGPMQIDRLRDLVRNGSIPRNALIWSDGWADWRPMAEVSATLAIPVGRPVTAHESATAPIAKGNNTMTLVLIIVGFVLSCWVALSLNSGERGPSVSSMKYNAEEAIQRQLKAPSTAEFSNVVLLAEKDGFVVVGDVDAQNIYGAMLRKRWVVKFNKDGAMVSASLIP